MIRVDTRPRRRNSGKADGLRRCSGHLQWIRSRPCILAKVGGCAGRVEAAHVDHAGGTGLGVKVADAHAVPLCSGHHGEYHQRGARTFERKHTLDLVQVASQFAHASPHWPKLCEQLESRA